ncbi:MAG: hypothetical protein JXA50_06575 [Deltaproteobacteria bacterium]|nr:hypothetical protein [Deltaproteobacteria bacterium]
MMKKRIFLGILAWGLVLYLSGSIYAQGFKPGTEPDNFRGIKWGTNIHSLPEMKFDTGSHIIPIKSYVRENDILMVGDASLSSVSYVFYKDQFCESNIRFQGWDNFYKIKQTAFSIYGEGEKTNEFIEKFRWEGPNVIVHLEYSEKTEKGFMSWVYWPIMKLIATVPYDKEKTKEEQEEFEILEVKYREVERSENYVTVAWLVKVQNNTNAAKEVLVEVQFLDVDGFELVYGNETAVLRPGEITTVTNTEMIKRDIYPQIKSIRARF